jgi:hypothetical protein
MHPFPIKYECVDCNKAISTYQAESTGGFCEKCDSYEAMFKEDYPDDACAECGTPYYISCNALNLEQIANHWLVKLAIKLRIIKL